MSIKKTKRHQNNPEIVDIVRYCMQFRLNGTETCKKLLERGHDISTRTIGRIKKKLLIPQRLDEIAEEESSSFIIESIAKLDDVEKKAEKVFDESKNPYVKLQALNMIIKSRKEKAEFYDSANIIVILGRKLRSKNDPVEKN